MKIEQLSNDEVSQVALLLREYWKERNMNYSQKWTESYLKKGHSIEIKKEVFFVLKEETELIGVISIVVWESDLAELRDFVIKKEFRGEGYGKKLLENSIEWCKKNRIRKIISLSFPKYEKFLEEYSFEREGYLKDHFADGEHLLIMGKRLK